MLEIAPDRIASTGDDSPVGSLAAFVWRMSRWRQLGLGALALLAAALDLAPIELQRRIVDDALMRKDLGLLLTLGALYAGALAAQRAVKLALGLLQGWLGESATYYCRRHLMRLWSRRAPGREGEAVSITGPEIDQLGGFVGAGPSSAIGAAGLLLGVIGYMLWTAPQAAGVSLALLTPQFLIAPLVQRKINALTEQRVGRLRDYGDAVSERDPERADDLACTLYRNKIGITLWKQIQKGALNLLNAAAPLGLLLYGGWMVIEGETTVGVLVAFLSGFQRITEPVRDLLRFYRDCSNNGVRHQMIARWM